MRKEEEKEMGVLYLDVDNSIDTIECFKAANSLLNFNVLESCLNFCHKYSIWYFDENIFRNIGLMNEMFELISKKVIGKHLKYAVNPPDQELSGEVKSVQFKYEQYNFIDKYSYIYGEEGVEAAKFIKDI